ncbi:MAG: tetratricopeptide repeat protein [candidate division Zixibacteria bacterium]|nr:tetratricopeptide repeat protein [candidate division Zixibacteria bacterium]
MTACSDERFKRMLPLYELDLLAEDERREFREHLLVCDECFDSAQQFQDAAEHLRRSQYVRTVVESLAADTGNLSEGVASERPKRRRLWSTLVPTSVAAAAVLAVLILKPWHVEIRPSEDVLAAHYRIAVMPFETEDSLTAELPLGRMAAHLLATDLAESMYLDVVASRRVQAILDGIAETAVGTAPDNIAARIAGETNADWVVTGRVASSDSAALITYEIYDAAAGRLERPQEIIGSPTEDIFSMVDRLSASIKKSLPLPRAASWEFDRDIAGISTFSAEAYSHYLAGIDAFDKLYYADAQAHFSEALKIDSTFAMAHYYMSRLGNAGAIARAVAYLDRTGERDKYYIRAQLSATAGDVLMYTRILRELIQRLPDEEEAYRMLAGAEYDHLDNDSAITHFRQATAIDPDDKLAYNMLAYAYAHAGAFDSAMASIDRYIALAPDEANPWDTRGEILAFYGRLDDAIASFEKAAEVKPDYPAASVNLGNMYLFKRDFSQAAKWYHRRMEYDSARYALNWKLDLVSILIQQGMLAEALQELDEFTTTFRNQMADAGINQDYSMSLLKKALIHSELGHYEAAVDNIRACAELYQRTHPGDVIGYRLDLVRVLVEAGRLDDAAAVAENFRKMADGSASPWYAVARDFSTGIVAVARGNHAEGIALLEEAARRIPARRWFTAHFVLARAYLEAGRFYDAVDKLEKLLPVYVSHRLVRSIDDVKLHYLLGRAYEGASQTDKAVEQYEIFLHLWRNADAGLAAVDDATSRLNRLKAKT